MSRDNYNNIKKYAAFIFMVFTVLSGSSDRIDSENFVKIGKKAFIDILATNKLFAQELKVSMNDSRIKKSERENESFRRFLDIDANNSGTKYIQIYLMLLIILLFYLNNAALKNNIWRRTVF